MTRLRSLQEALEEAQKAASVAAAAVMYQKMASVFIEFLLPPEAYAKAIFPSIIKWAVRFVGDSAVRDACQISQARLNRWLAGISPEPQERARFISTIRIILEESMPT